MVEKGTTGPEDATRTRETIDEGLSRRPAPEPTLRVLFSGLAGMAATYVHRLHAAVTPIGRADSAGVVLADDARASRLHASVLRDAVTGVLTLVDAGSRHGVFVNGARVDQAPLRDGDVLRLGDSFLLLRYEPPDPEDADVPGLIGISPGARALRAAIRRIAEAPVGVLALGESGTGKEVVARALHELSGRRGPFVAINCSAIPETLAESQLFGHVARAFTGATAQPGVFRAADGGTLLLDEIGELPAALQPKLLRVLEDRHVLPIGATTAVRCDVRVIAATNRDLHRAVETGGFRGDLHARIMEVVLRLPALRERREDILLLLHHAMGQPMPRLTARLVEVLLLHAWPYNVREVVRLATHLRVCAPGAPVLDLDHVADRLPQRTAWPSPPALAEAAGSAMAEPAPRGRAPTREVLEETLRAHQGVMTKVAAALGRSRRQVYRWLDQYGLDPTRYR